MKLCPKCSDKHSKPGIFCSRTCANGREHSAATKLRMSESAKANPAGCIADRSKTFVPPKGVQFGKISSNPDVQLTCQECSKQWTVRHHLGHRKYCSEACSNKNKYHTNSTRRLRSMYQGYQMDSGAELVFAQLLDQHDIKWEKNSTRSFPFVDSLGKDRLYYPDFYLPEYDHWVEIKGKRYIREDDNLRLAAVGNIELMMSNDIRLPNCVSDPYGI